MLPPDAEPNSAASYDHTQGQVEPCHDAAAHPSLYTFRLAANFRRLIISTAGSNLHLSLKKTGMSVRNRHSSTIDLGSPAK